MVRGWTEGKTFQDLLWMEDYVDKFEMVFKRIGRMIAKFHMLIYDKVRME
jgi:tRNA A-37 threonylcarbamoyl transferase component Bud32